MKRISISIIIYFCCILTAQAQHQISGSIKDGADSSPVSYATAALLRPDSSVITGVTTDDSGHFVLENVAPGSYLVQLSFIGYQKTYRSVSVPTESELGAITLSENTNMLNEVVIVSRRQLLVPKLDRMVINVAGNIITSGLNMQDLLKQLPGLVVDENNNVKLNGRNAIVYIDGRPTRLPTEMVGQMLKGMMGDAVDRVELIDNPSSRYEAGMSSAIVNIRLKKDASLGVNGTVTAGIGFTENDLASIGGLNLNYRTRKVNIFGNYGYNNTPNNIDLYQKRNYSGDTPVTYEQTARRKSTWPSHTLRAGMDWFVTSKQTIGFLFSGTYNNMDGDFDSNAAIMQTGTSKIDSTEQSDSWFTQKYSSQVYNLNYRLTGDKGEELTVDADYGHMYGKNWQDMQSRYFSADGSEHRLPTEFQYSGPRTINILSLKADFVKPLSEKSSIEVGAKTGKTNTENDILYENLYGGQWEVDPNQTNSFNYAEHVSAAYATYSHKFGKFSAMAGLRTEYTSIKGESPTTNTTFRRDYWDWFPSAYLQYQINERQGLNLSYSRKINRPGYSLLNPFREYIDPFTYSSGNPDLSPSYPNTFALRYNIGGYTINASYSQEKDVFERVYMQDDENQITNISSRNIGKRNQLTLSAFAPIQLAQWYALSVYAEARYAMVEGLYNGSPLKTNYLEGNIFLQHAFTIQPTLRANLQMMWMSPSRQGSIAKFDNIWTMNAQIEKSFLDKRLSLVLSCNDIFSSMVYKGKINFGNISQDFKEDHHQRQLLLTVKYSFGSQQIRSTRNRNVGIEDEIGRSK